MALPNPIVDDPAAQRNFEELDARTNPRLLGKLFAGTGTPEGNVVAPIGSLYFREDGGIGTTMYVKEASGGVATGWAAK